MSFNIWITVPKLVITNAISLLPRNCSLVNKWRTKIRLNAGSGMLSTWSSLSTEKQRKPIKKKILRQNPNLNKNCKGNFSAVFSDWIKGTCHNREVRHFVLSNLLKSKANTFILLPASCTALNFPECNKNYRFFEMLWKFIKILSD